MRSLALFAAAASLVAFVSLPALAQDDAAGAIATFHATWCQDTYQNYDAASDTFTDFDGQSYVCVSPVRAPTQTFASAGSAPVVLSAPAVLLTPALRGNPYVVFPGEDDPSYAGGVDNNGADDGLDSAT
jgi:hypothetical protein